MKYMLLIYGEENALDETERSWRTSSMRLGSFSPPRHYS